ncbi:MAG: hypothetical protein ABI231_04120 [Candidatus Tumulicola sp.]
MPTFSGYDRIDCRARSPRSSRSTTRSCPSSDSPFFIGFIEKNDHVAGATRIAFRVEPARMFELLLPRIGAHKVERSEDIATYPAIFFEDACGTKLEIVARPPAAPAAARPS